MLRHHHHHLSLELLPSRSSETLHPLKDSLLLAPQLLTTIQILSVSIHFSTLGTSYEWNQVVFVLLLLSIMSLKSIHAMASARLSFLFKKG